MPPIEVLPFTALRISVISMWNLHIEGPRSQAASSSSTPQSGCNSPCLFLGSTNDASSGVSDFCSEYLISLARNVHLKLGKSGGAAGRWASRQQNSGKGEVH